MSNITTCIVRFVLRIWLKIPFGYICRVHHQDAYMTLHKNYWVHVVNGNSIDTLPINVVSHHLQNEFALRMKAIGYNVDEFFDHNAYAHVATDSAVAVQHENNQVAEKKLNVHKDVPFN